MIHGILLNMLIPRIVPDTGGFDLCFSACGRTVVYILKFPIIENPFLYPCLTLHEPSIISNETITDTDTDSLA